MARRPAVAAAWAAALVASPAGAQSAPEQPGSARASPSGLELVALRVIGRGGVHAFTVEVARTQAEQARGLMHRQRLAPDAGMLFPFPSARPASFWMKDTLIPLDMIFIRPNGTIARIAANTVPHSRDPVAVAEPVAAVLEIAGGRAAQLRIKVGDRVTWGERR